MLYGVPQGTVLGPKLFSQYAEDVTEILERCMQHHHIYADDMQGLRHGKPAEILQIVTQVENGINEIARWCASRRLQLNQSKTEIMWFGTAANLKKLSSEDQRVAIGSSSIEPSSSVRNLGVYLDSQMTMKEHVTRTARICFHHIRRLWGILGERAFSVAGPLAWNRLPLELRANVNTASFKRQLKTYLYQSLT
jgi:hypothetical protein